MTIINLCARVAHANPQEIQSDWTKIYSPAKDRTSQIYWGDIVMTPRQSLVLLQYVGICGVNRLPRASAMAGETSAPRTAAEAG